MKKGTTEIKTNLGEIADKIGRGLDEIGYKPLFKEADEVSFDFLKRMAQRQVFIAHGTTKEAVFLTEGIDYIIVE